MRPFPRAAPVMVAAFLLAAPLAAQDTPPVADTAVSDSAGSVWLLGQGGLWVRGGIGRFNAARDPQLPGQRGHLSFAFGFGAEFASAPFLSLELEILSTVRTYDTEGGAFIIVIDDETSVSSNAFTLGGRISLPPDSPVRVYATGGLAYVHTTFETDASLLGIPGTANKQSDGAFRPVVGGGIQVILGAWEVHADYRRLTLSGSFPEYEVDEVDLGGNMLIFGIGWRSGGPRR
ncbi:MAG TPA: outer membrane beta-barrel protein [Longimicrobiales bacterium]|nr:outer membrane beta-barrel protein [Longimicrobiales bacterium]